jgi:hypothetical protein
MSGAIGAGWIACFQYEQKRPGTNKSGGPPSGSPPCTTCTLHSALYSAIGRRGEDGLGGRLVGTRSLTMLLPRSDPQMIADPGPPRMVELDMPAMRFLPGTRPAPSVPGATRGTRRMTKLLPHFPAPSCALSPFSVDKSVGTSVSHPAVRGFHGYAQFLCSHCYLFDFTKEKYYTRFGIPPPLTLERLFDNHAPPVEKSWEARDSRACRPGAPPTNGGDAPPDSEGAAVRLA